MSIELILAVIGVALQFTTMAAAWTLGGAARWRRARWFTAVTLTAGMYCVVDVVGALQIMQGMNHDWTMGTNLVLATVHAATWLILRSSTTPEDGSRSRSRCAASASRRWPSI